ncbi:MAG: TIGR00730 family Rossman fold protein [Verrucomicrobiota bacterium]|nr:TIGR00730 family Rossman fold protein [Verrucomicrobiota bacterium]MCC6820571.1 TIGR00730 family Rossman fold protein [Limisphaerales bacterium]
MKRLCVFCGSSPGNSAAFTTVARELGETIAARGMELVYGGAQVGLMGVVADAALARGGKVIGVLPRFMADKELAHPKLTQLHVVDTMHERKRFMADLAEGFVALPGGFGTCEEIFEAITWSQLHLHHRPCALLNVAGYYDSLLAFLDSSVIAGFVRPDLRASLIVAGGVAELFAGFANFRPAQSEKWISKNLKTQ